MRSGVAWVLGVLAVSLLFQGVKCLNSSVDEQVSTVNVEPRKYLISEEQQGCIERGAFLAWGEMWQAITENKLWSPSVREYVLDNADIAQGILLTIMDPAAYATGFCLAQRPPVAPDRTFFIKNLENVSGDILADKIGYDVALSKSSTVVSAEQNPFERKAQQALLEDPFADCKRQARKFAWVHIVPDALDAKCGGADKQSAELSLNQVTEKITCQILRSSHTLSFSYFSIARSYGIGYQGFCDYKMPEMSPSDRAAYLDTKYTQTV